MVLVCYPANETFNDHLDAYLRMEEAEGRMRNGEEKNEDGAGLLRYECLAVRKTAIIFVYIYVFFLRLPGPKLKLIS